MAKKKNGKGTSDKSKRNVEIYEHKGKKRLNNPQVGLVNTKTEKEEKKKSYSFDPHLDPTLQWAGKAERLGFEIPSVALHVHERIDSRSIIEAVKKSEKEIWEQLSLFNRPINKLNFIKEIEFYQHQKDWSNRLIAGDSLLVMNSLLEREAMGGKVQVVYIDPPYGISYGSNFQPFVNKRDVKDGKDEDLTQEPETIRAFRDTWSLGVHSYLSYLRDRVLLSRDLLSETGSIFFQIGEDNLHLVRNVLDEIFGAENFMSQITFRVKNMPFGAKYLENMYDHVIWYAKDKEKIKFRKIFQPRRADPAEFSFVEEKDGSFRKLTEVEKKDFDKTIKEKKVFSRLDLYSSGYTPTCIYNIEFEGRTYKPQTGKSWKTTKDGIEILRKANRLFALGDKLYYKYYYNDYPVTLLTNFWDDTAGGFSEAKKYVVQTHPKVIERCLLMTSDPGDLVFDPTCGSGTTAFVSEKIGRRWITCDSSRVATTLAKQRIMTSVFDYYKLASPEEGAGSGFVYNKAPHITLGSITNGLSSAEETLLDQPMIDDSKVRVSGPFTVEAVPAPVVKGVSQESSPVQSLNGPTEWIAELLKSGIRAKQKEFIKLSRLEPLQGTRWIHAEGASDERQPQRVVISFGPDFAPLEQKQVELALQEVEKLKPSPTIIVFAAFQFDPEAAKDIDEVDWGGVSVLKVQMNADLFTDDLKKKRSSNESFWLIGQPDISTDILKSGENKGKIVVKVNGFDYYNPKTGTVESGGNNRIAMWLLDTDYDGRSLFPRQVFFPMSGPKDGWAKLAKTLTNEINEDLIEAYKGTESLPFQAGEYKRVAVKIIDDRGIESLTIREIK